MPETDTHVNTSLGANSVWLLSLPRPRRVPDDDWFNDTCVLCRHSVVVTLGCTVNLEVMWALRRLLDPSSSLQGGHAILKSSRTYCCLPKSCKHFEGQCGSTFLSDPFLSRTHLGSHGRRPSLLPLGLSSDSLNLYFLIQFLKSW